jgi:hypothetical protein
VPFIPLPFPLEEEKKLDQNTLSRPLFFLSGFCAGGVYFGAGAGTRLAGLAFGTGAEALALAAAVAAAVAAGVVVDVDVEVGPEVRRKDARSVVSLLRAGLVRGSGALDEPRVLFIDP